MATFDFNKYLDFLGKKVSFFNPTDEPNRPNQPTIGQFVTGVIEGVVFFQDSSSPEFYLGFDTYSFEDVIFFTDLEHSEP